MYCFRKLLVLALVISVVFPLYGQGEQPSGTELPSEIEEIVQSNYLLGTGDRIRIVYFDKRSIEDEGKQFKVVIHEDGTIFLPLLGEIVASGKTPPQLKEDIRSRLFKYLIDPVVRVEVLEEHAQSVVLLGACNKQGVYPIQDGMTLSRFLAINGGLSLVADVSRISVLRVNGELINVNLASYFEFGDTSQDIVLQKQDRIYVPQKQEDFLGKIWRLLQVTSVAMQVVILLVVMTR